MRVGENRCVSVSTRLRDHLNAICPSSSSDIHVQLSVCIIAIPKPNIVKRTIIVQNHPQSMDLLKINP